MIDGPDLTPILPAYLERQRWTGARDRAIEKVDIEAVHCLQRGWPALLHVFVGVGFATGDPARYQLLLGMRPDGEPAEFLHGHAAGVLGNVDTEDGPAYVYDALLDADLDLALLARVAPKEAAWRARPVGTEQSNTSIVFDDRLIMKLFRRLTDGPNPDVEITTALAEHGFAHIAPVVATWQEAGSDLAVVQEYLAGGVEGWALALTSLRDLYDKRSDPAETGGDFQPEAFRLGQVTAELHGALADALGSAPGDPSVWADSIDAQLAAVGDGVDAARLHPIVERLRALEPARSGAVTRIHGDYHLGQVMRTDQGWYVLDFEGEPVRPLEERRQMRSPLKDVAGMLRSFHYAAEAAKFERDDAAAADEVGLPLADLARAWEERNREAFLVGYTKTVEPRIVPPDPEAVAVVLSAYELEKAVYELAYERAHRPDWSAIPLAALTRLVGTGSNTGAG